jgi:hypothetical protein
MDPSKFLMNNMFLPYPAFHNLLHPPFPPPRPNPDPSFELLKQQYDSLKLEH